MSTKHTIQHHIEPNNAAGPCGFHFYKDALDEDYGPFYLRLDGVAFEATHESVTVTIPRDWAKMLGLLGHNV